MSSAGVAARTASGAGLPTRGRWVLGTAMLLVSMVVPFGPSIGAEVRLDRHTQGAGGRPGATAAGLRLNGTVGQVAAGESVSPSHRLRSGFWIPRISLDPTGVPAAANGLPLFFHLGQNHPNPFSDRTTMRYALPREEHVRLALFDVRGREVLRLVDGLRPAGEHTHSLRGDRLRAGVYFYRLQTSAFTDVKKLVLVD